MTADTTTDVFDTIDDVFDTVAHEFLPYNGFTPELAALMEEYFITSKVVLVAVIFVATTIGLYKFVRLFI